MGLLSPVERGLGSLLAPLQPGLQDRGTPCPCHHCPSSPRALPSESGTAPGPGQAAAGPGLRGSAPPAGPGTAPILNPHLRACSHPHPSHILRCCSPSRSVHCGSDLGSTGHRLECWLEESRSHSHQTDTLQSHTEGDTAHPGREASTGSGRDSPSRGPGPPGSSPLHPNFLLGRCSQHHRPHLHLCPRIPLLRASDTGALGSWAGRSIESQDPPAQGSLSSCHCVGMEKEGRSQEGWVGSGSQGPHSH